MTPREEELEAHIVYLQEQIDALTKVAAVPAIRAALNLTEKQARLLLVLTRRCNMMTTHEAAYRAVFEHPNGDGPHQKIVDVVLCQIRAALRDAKAPGRIETIYGSGWKATADLTAWVRSIINPEQQDIAA